ncbi:MAG TPA: hypothetical protein VK993_10555 [Chthoniobacterales bacterium]|nr:hypothetical protein [Chthoniobacterales bacterium]
MVNFGYHLARAHGAMVRYIYIRSLSTIVRRKPAPRAVLPFEVYSYSGEAALPEQVASIRSLLRHAGRPRKFTVVSDGTYTQRSVDLLQAIDGCVSVSPVTEWVAPDTIGRLHAYLSGHPTGKQLALIMSLPVHGPALYIDSDVLFFASAADLHALKNDSAPACYLADCQVSADERLFRDRAERDNPVNTGVLFISEKLDWAAAISRLLELEEAPSFFTNQTITQLAMHANGARPLDPRKFVLQLDDQFVYRDRYAGPAIALRHYVNPVRHKFWTSIAR